MKEYEKSLPGVTSKMLTYKPANVANQYYFESLQTIMIHSTDNSIYALACLVYSVTVVELEIEFSFSRKHEN